MESVGPNPRAPALHFHSDNAMRSQARGDLRYKWHRHDVAGPGCPDNQEGFDRIPHRHPPDLRSLRVIDCHETAGNDRLGTRVGVTAELDRPRIAVIPLDYCGARPR